MIVQYISEQLSPIDMHITSVRLLCQITSYGGQLAYMVHSESSYGAGAIEPGPDVIIHVCLF